MIVAQEQAREVNGQISDEAFIPASSAAMEAIVNQTLKREEKKVHPMFRRTSTNNSTSTNGMDDDNDIEAQQPRKRRKTNGKVKANGNGTGKVKEEPIDFVDSDDDLDEKPATKGRGRGGGKASESPLSDEDDPQALFKVDQSRLVLVSLPYVKITNPKQSQPVGILPADVDVVDRYPITRRRRKATSMYRCFSSTCKVEADPGRK